MNKLRILILENDPDDAELIVQALRDARLSSVPKCIDSKADFKETLEEFKPSIILSDYRMPVFYCLTALMILKERSPKVPLLIISEEICREVTAEAISTSSCEYALKDNLLSIGYAVQKVMDKFVKRNYRRIEGEGSATGEKRFKELFGNYGSGIAFYKAVDDGRDFVLSDCNGALERIKRLNREDLIGKGVLDLFPGVSDSGLFNDIHRVWKSGIPSHHPMNYYKDDRIEGWREIYLYKVPSGDIVALYVDITSNRLLEEELQKSEERFSLIADSSFDAIFIIDREGRVRYISPAITRVMGYDPADLINRPFTDYMPGEEKKKARETLRALLEGKIIEGFRQTVVRKDGEFVHVEINAAPIMKCTEIVGIQGALRDITERLRAEKQIVTLARFPSENPNPVLRASYDGTVLFANKASEKLLDFWECGVGKPLPAEWTKIIREVYDSGENRYLELEFKEEFYSLSIAPVYTEGYINIYGMDITEKKRAEGRLHLLTSAVEQMGEGIAIIDLDGRFLFVNNAYAGMHGFKQEELEGKLLTDIHKGDQLPAIDEANRILKETGSFSGEVWRKRRDGTVFPTIMQNLLLRNSEGREIGIVNTISDITRRKKEEVELKKLSLAVQQSPVGIVITDAEGNIDYVNPSFEAATGYSFDDLLGKNPRILKSGEHSIEFYKNLWDTILQGNEWGGEFHNRKKNGDLYWESASISPIKNEDGRITHFLGVKEDITKRKLLEQQLIHSQKMEAIGTLAGGIAHDFNNMLSVIIGYSDFLLMKLGKEDEQYKIIGEIKKSGQRASNVAQQLLAFSRKQVLRKSLINLNFVVTDMQKMLMRLIDEDISLETAFGENLHMIYADRVQVEQTLMNLIINARDAMPLGGTVTIATENMLVDEQYCKEYPYARPGEYACLSVADTGIGLEESTSPRVFDPFFTTKEFGTGLGLSVVYGIVKQHDGWINLSSEPGKGTKFNIFFPASVTSEGETIEVSVRVDKLAGRGEHVLLVEDDRILREFTANVLRENGYTVVEARNTEEALKQFDKQNGKFDLIFSDVVLPDRSGVDLAEILTNRHKNLKVLLASGYLDRRSKWEVIKQRGYHFIQKPYSLQKLLKGIQDALQKVE
ncbi:MAG TPA: PAS domain S-box protein [Spirochaetota bacterium]|nr:PAS domain S-box protein [Spirochaetota bacterium]